MGEIQFTSRYDVFGPPSGCDGDCEGTGWIPIASDETDETYHALWLAAHNAPDAHPYEPCDGWYFIRCPKCNAGD
jgi:hypothetical protein